MHLNTKKNRKKVVAFLGAASILLSGFSFSNMTVAATELKTETYMNDAYDVLKVANDFESEVNEGSGDLSHYKIVDSEYQCWNISSGLTFESNYLTSLDFMYTDDTQTMMVKNSKNNVGPYFSVRSNGTEDGSYTFRTQTASNKYQDLYAAFQLNKWYCIELEGRMTVENAATNFRLYEYAADGTKTLVCEVPAINLRNMGVKSAGYMSVSDGVCIDNEYAYQLNPDEVVISEAEQRTTVRGGGSLNFEAKAVRNKSAENLSQPNIVWSLQNIIAGEEAYFSLDSGILTVGALASAQEITVCATASSNGNPVGNYTVSVESLDASQEPFDTAAILGSDTVKTGASVSYSFQAFKGGEDVTANLSAEDYSWQIYDSTGIRILGNKNITVENGVVTVDVAAVGQTVRLRLSTRNGVVYTEKELTIVKDTKETIIGYNACEDKLDSGNAIVKQGSWDGSSYYEQVSSDFLGAGILGTNQSSSTTSDAVAVNMDIKFQADGAGIITARRDGGTALYLVNHGGKLACQISGSKYNDLVDAAGNYCEIDSNSWYHLELMVCNPGASLNIAKYDENGVLGEASIYTEESGVAYRSSQGFNRILVNSNTAVDNYMAVYPEPDALEIQTTDGITSVAAGSNVSFSVVGSRHGLIIPRMSASKVTWEVYDNENLLPTEDENISITAGTLSTYALTKAQTVYVRAFAATNKNVYASYEIKIEESNLLEITNIGVSADDTDHIEKIYVTKRGDYKEDIVFLMAFYDENRKLLGSYAKKVYGKNLKVGVNEVSVDYQIPEEFDKETGTAEIMAWTALGMTESPAGISGSFEAAYQDETLTLNQLPELKGQVTLAVIADGVKEKALTGNLEGKVYALAQSEEGTIRELKVPDLTAGSYHVVVGATVDGVYQVYTTTLTIEKKASEITALPKASAITYGDTLAKAVLTDGAANTAGTFAWENASAAPVVSDSNTTEYTVIFTPDDSKNYLPATCKITVTVNKAENAPGMPDGTMEAAEEVKTVGELTLPDNWEWSKADSERTLNWGETVCAVAEYTGKDCGNYKNENVTVTITKEACKHPEEMKELRNQKDASCSEAGYTGDVYCTKCGVLLEEGTEIEKTKHSYKSEVTKEPTTKEEGIRTYTCENCGDTYTESIEKVSESPVEQIVNVIKTVWENIKGFFDKIFHFGG